MATRLKTVQYAFPAQASLTNNTLTTLTQITVYLPETGTKTFRSVTAHITCDDIITATGGTVTTKTFNLRLGAAGYTSVANANTLTNSGENHSFYFVADYTSHFNTNWTGTSMTCDFQVQLNHSTGTTTDFVNVCVTLEITYEYDDTSTTHVKTVMIPLNAPTGAIATAATTYDTIPALDTYLPESSKAYRDIFVVMQGNEHRNAATTDHTMTLRVGSASVTTGNYEGALASDRAFRYVWDVTSAYPDTSTTQTWQPTATVARVNHFQAWLVVTYEFDESASTSIMNSVMLPMAVDSPMGGTTSSDYQRADRYLDIEEPGTIVTSRVAFFCHWTQIAAIGGLNMRIGTGSFVAYTDVASVLCGANGAMVRNDSAFTLVRGRNTLNFDVYRTDTADFGFNVSGFWLVNYTSDKSSDGSGSHNHTVLWTIAPNGTAASASLVTVSATAPAIPETEHYFTALGARLVVQPAGATQPAALIVQVERLSAEGGVAWESVYLDTQQTDAELGYYFAYAQMRTLFNRWPSDAGSGRMDLETSRRWRIVTSGGSAAAPGWFGLTLVLTYHSILAEVADTITNSAGGTVTVSLHDEATGEVLRTTTRSGNGAVAIPFFGDTRSVYLTAREDDTHVGRGPNTTPTLT